MAFIKNVLSASVPPEVKNISPGVTSKISAILFLEFSTEALTSLPCL